MRGNEADPERPDSRPDAVRVPADALRSFVAAVFSGYGLGEEEAATSARALVEADLRGVWSHGVARVSMYAKRLAAGVAKPSPSISVTEVAVAASLVDGDDGLGLVVAPRAMSEAIRLADKAGIGLAGVRRSGHFGMAALYADQAAASGKIGMVFTTASPAIPPWGGARAFLGTSPLAVAAPTKPDSSPFSLDMAMTTVARGKLKFAAQRGEPIPAGLALDKEGRPTTDGAAAFEGTLLPFGGVKGAGLSWMMDVLAGAFTSAHYGGEVGNPFTTLDRPQGTGHLFIAMRADLFLPLTEFMQRLDNLAARAKALPMANGVDEILSPGEPERRRAATNCLAGVPLTADVRADLAATGAAVGVDWAWE